MLRAGELFLQQGFQRLPWYFLHQQETQVRQVCVRLWDTDFDW